ncbi:hypothetical protein [uncultured Chryseobacterium sp.]|jgi:hypothetical protein|uniref:DUF7660 family protein n=1 Tax=uncultured Chryseobacterium sp. TaxID=259322 RepID=UPI0026098EFC|nr:hypothetical protein [uncultured Chryseobacterium sp.]
MDDLTRKVFSISSKDDFTGFLELLISDFKSNPGEWENKDLESYLEAVASWTDDMEGYYINHNLPIPKDVDWRTFATILLAARIYE